MTTVASKIPTETLCEIFLLLCDGPIALNELRNQLRSHEFPWAVGQVCRHWRWAFLSYPTLWSSLSFEEPQPDACDPSASYIAEMNRRTALYLKRSEQQPLTLTVSVLGQISEKVYTTVWGMLLSFSDRWKWAGLDIKNESMINDLVERRKKMSILESLTIVVYNVQDNKYSTAFETAPLLTELILNCGDRRAGARGTLQTWPFPWAQLTRLTIDLPTLHFANNGALRSFLLQFQNIEELHITPFSVKLDSDVPECSTIRFPRLRLFGISLDIPWILSFFETPVLEHLSVCDGFEDVDARYNYDDEISSFVQRSSCHIRRLTLGNCTLGVAQHVIFFLDHVEELSVEQYSNVEYAHRIIRDIADSFGRRLYKLPNLRVLEVSCCPGYFEDVVRAAAHLLSVRSTKSRSGHNIAKLIVTVGWDDCDCDRCNALNKVSEPIDKALKYLCLQPSFTVLSLDSDRWDRTLTVYGSVIGAQVDLTLQYPDGPNAYEFYSKQSSRHIDILESKRTQE